MAYQNFTFTVDSDGIALVTWNMAGRSMNVITVPVMDELERLIGEFSADAAIRGVIITSGKDAFSGGADITLNGKLTSSMARKRLKETQSNLRAALSE